MSEAGNGDPGLADAEPTELPEPERLPRRRAGRRTHPVAYLRIGDPAVPIGTLLRIRRALEERL